MNTSILDKIRKLFAHAQSAGELGNQAEAEAFAGKANDLLIQHKLDVSLLDMTEAETEEQVDSVELGARDLFGISTISGWRQSLLTVLAKAHFCRSCRIGTSTVAVVGAPSDREVVLYLLDQLLRVAPKLAAKAVPEPISWARSTRRDRNAWLLGFVVGLRDKLAETRQAAERNPNALVVLNTAREKTDDVFERTFPRSRNVPGPRTTGAASAYAAGKAAGRSHNLTHGVRGGGGAASRVTGGSLRLGAGA